MGSNSFGTIFRITTWGESHGEAVGCVIDGCPAGLELNESDIQNKLDARAPGRCEHVSPRKETDRVKILSGVFEGKTTGAPICLMVANVDHDSSKYEQIKDILRPGHANFTYLEKYGIFDWRGGGRASARETVARVAAGAVAEKILSSIGVKIVSHLKSVGNCFANEELLSSNQCVRPDIFCLAEDDELRMKHALNQEKEAGDSIGGVVECVAFHLPAGLGDPIYEKIEAKLAAAMMSLPASKAFEIGDGIEASTSVGSEHNDSFRASGGVISCASNHAGGTLGGITTGMPLVVRTHFKPASSIQKKQKSVDTSGKEVQFSYPEGSRHDPCVAIRAVPVCQAMCALVLVDAYLMNRLSCLLTCKCKRQI